MNLLEVNESKSLDSRVAKFAALEGSGFNWFENWSCFDFTLCEVVGRTKSAETIKDVVFKIAKQKNMLT